MEHILKTTLKIACTPPGRSIRKVLIIMVVPNTIVHIPKVVLAKMIGKTSLATKIPWNCIAMAILPIKEKPTWYSWKVSDDWKQLTREQRPTIREAR